MSVPAVPARALRPRLVAALEVAGLALLFALLAYLFLYPASFFAITGERRFALGSDGDALTLPFHAHLLKTVWQQHPSHLLFGSVYVDQLNPPTGVGLFFAWIDRILMLLLVPFASFEAVPALHLMALLVLDGLCFYGFARHEGFSRKLALAFAIAFAFNPFTRARATAHPALAGLYYLPLVVWGLRACQRAKSGRGLVLPALLFLGAATAAHYYWMITFVLTPVWLFIYLTDHPARPAASGAASASGDSDSGSHSGAAVASTRPSLAARARRWLAGRWRWMRSPLFWLGAAAAPAVAFIAWSFLVPLPPGVHDDAPAARPPPSVRYVRTFATLPLDYLSGDVANGEADLLPPRRALNAYVTASLNGSNLVERANGIRWSVLLAAFVVLAVLARQQRRAALTPSTRRRLGAYIVLMVVAFLCALPPHKDFGLARLVFAIVPNLRVPSRFGPIVHFAMLGLLGTFAAQVVTPWLRERRPLRLWATALAGALPALMVVEALPVTPILTYETSPARLDLMPQDGGPCGAGIVLPYVSTDLTRNELYRAQQELRGTDCQLNHVFATAPEDRALYQLFGELPYRDDTFIALRQFVLCTGAQWIAFRDTMPPSVRTRVCDEVGFVRVSATACRAPPRPAATAPLVRRASKCVPAGDTP